MAKTEVFSDMRDILKGQYNGSIVDTDGEIDIGRTYNFTPATNAPQMETLTEIHNERGVVVRTDLISEDFTFAFALRDPTSAARVRLVADGTSPTIDQSYRLLRHAMQGQLLQNDYKTGLPKEYKLRVTALPQEYSTDVFPVAASLVAADDATAGNFTTATYYVWVVPVYRDTDDKHGPTDTDFTLANWANLIRGEHYVYGTPAEETAGVAMTATHSLLLTFDEPTIGSGVYKPTHFAVVTGLVDDITDAGSHVCAIAAWTGGSHNLVISAVGTVDFGAVPVLPDYLLVQTGGLASEARVWTSEVEDTDYTVDRVNDWIKRIAGGDISADEQVRINVWFGANPSDETVQGGQGSAERYEWLRFTNLRPDGTDPDSRRVEGVVIDFPRVNTATITKSLAAAAKDGFHDPVPFSGVKAEVSPTEGYACRIRRFAVANAANVDMYSDDITPQNG